MSSISTNPSCRSLLYMNLLVGGSYYILAKRSRLLSNSSLRIQLLAFAVSTIVQLLRIKDGSIQKQDSFNRVLTILPLILNGSISRLSSLSTKLTLLNTVVFGGSHALQLLYLHQKRKHAITHILSEIDALFSGMPKKIYTDLLSTTQDVNAQYEGWTLLHYCVYCFNIQLKEPPQALLSFDIVKLDRKTKGTRFIQLMQYLVTHGADIEKPDLCGRTPIYFASGLDSSQKGLNKMFWEQSPINRSLICPDNLDVQPLHTLASLGDKYVIDLISKGAATDAVDKYGRMPLHCAAIHTFMDENYNNVRALVEYEPKSLEHQDQFENYPLYYAAVFGTSGVFKFLLKKSSQNVVSAVLKKLKQETLSEKQLIEKYKIDDPIYNVPFALKIYYGAGRDKNNVEKNKKELEEKETTKKTNYKGYDDYHDGHGWKHVINGEKYKQRFKTETAFVKSTRNNPALFFPEYGNKYESLIKSCVEFWVDKKNAKKDDLYVSFSENIGADNGKLTKTVELYFTDSGGVHIRPKSLEKS